MQYKIILFDEFYIKVYYDMSYSRRQIIACKLHFIKLFKLLYYLLYRVSKNVTYLLKVRYGTYFRIGRVQKACNRYSVSQS